jgi:hypothetical protein
VTGAGWLVGGVATVLLAAALAAVLTLAMWLRSRQSGREQKTGSEEEQ